MLEMNKPRRNVPGYMHAQKWVRGEKNFELHDIFTLCMLRTKEMGQH